MSAPPAAAPTRVWVILAFGLLAFGSSPILVRLASAAQEAGGVAPDGMALLVWRTAFATLLLTPWALGRRGRAEMAALGRRDWALIGFSGVFLGLHFLAWIESLFWTSVASTSVLVTTSPLFIAVLGRVFLGERLPLRTVLAIVLAVCGAALIGWGDVGGAAPNPALGNALALTGALLVAVYLLAGRAVRQRATFLSYVFPLYALAAAAALVGALVRGSELAQPPAVLAWCLAMAVFPQLLGHGSVNYAVRYLPAALLGLLTLAEPVLASGLALVLFGEVPGPRALAGMAVVVAAVAWVLAGRRR